ncbi:hypothetical protein C7M84_022241 [Penaeus vannamei]|uniref:Uncharacterized protein n=1 Tax=Penaeus vannamei TaxID=6689 RepID=A0A423U782_PENVA|nr:hypothetical protein C7M84_022241 [Penaeus vannamei]
MGIQGRVRSPAFSVLLVRPEDSSLEGARMRTLFSLRLLLGLSRLLGCFPYAVKLNPPKITFKKHLFAYSVVFIAFAITSTFVPVDEALLSETPVFLVKTKAHSHGCKSSEEAHHSPSVSVMERLRSVRLGLCDLDQLLRDVNDHFGPLLCVCLASDQLFVITFLQDLISNRNYSIFVSLIVVLLAFIRIFLVMNTPGMVIRELDEIEHDLANCPKFEVCGLFEIGRQSLLPKENVKVNELWCAVAHDVLIKDLEGARMQTLFSLSLFLDFSPLMGREVQELNPPNITFKKYLLLLAYSVVFIAFTITFQHSPSSVSAMERLQYMRLGLCAVHQLLRDVDDHFGPLLCVCLASDQLLLDEIEDDPANCPKFEVCGLFEIGR